MHHPAMVEEFARSFQSDLLKEAEKSKLIKESAAGNPPFPARSRLNPAIWLASLALGLFRWG